MIIFSDSIFSTKKLCLGLLVCFAASVGCVPSESVQDSSSAHICMQHAEAQNDAQTIVPDEPLQVYVMICGHSNWESVETWCEAEVSGQDITISSRFDYRTTSKTVLTICYNKVAACDLPALSEGTYTVIHGETEKELVVPSDEVLDCSRVQGYL